VFWKYEGLGHKLWGRRSRGLAMLLGWSNCIRLKTKKVKDSHLLFNSCYVSLPYSHEVVFDGVIAFKWVLACFSFHFLNVLCSYQYINDLTNTKIKEFG